MHAQCDQSVTKHGGALGGLPAAAVEIVIHMHTLSCCASNHARVQASIPLEPFIDHSTVYYHWQARATVLAKSFLQNKI